MKKDIDLHDKEAFLKMHAAGKLAADVLDYITSYVKSGVSTGYLNDLCHDYILKNNDSESSKKDEVTELAVKVLFIGGSGRWKKLKGQSCNFVYFEYEEGSSHAKVKCSIYEELISFFKSQ